MMHCGSGDGPSDHRDVPPSPPHTVGRRLAPFAGAACLGLALGVVPAGDTDWSLIGTSVTITLSAVLLAVAAPWQRLPSWTRALPAFAYLGAVAILREAAGGATAGFGPLLLLPVFWLALYGTPRQLGAVLVGVAAVFYVPLLAIGGPLYPLASWRTGALFVVVGAIVGFTVQNLVARLRVVLAERADLLVRLERLAASDPLTGLANRRRWDDELGRALAQAARHGRAVSIAAIDLDRFKAVNDAHGHQYGDRVLHAAAEAWTAQIRPGDVLARLGGEEFALLLADCPLSGARGVVERVRAATPYGQTSSAGIAEWDGRESPSELLARADRMLYLAKEQGRDRSIAARRPGTFTNAPLARVADAA